LAASAAAGPVPCVLAAPLLLEVLDAPPLLLLEVLLDVLLELAAPLLLDVLPEALLLALPVDAPMVALVVVSAAAVPEPLLETSTPPQPPSTAPTQKIPSNALGRMKFDIM
jgi:hypothetical protein